MTEHDDASGSSTSGAVAADQPAVTRPRPSPTSRARRAAAAGVEPSRPAPRPRPADGASDGTGTRSQPATPAGSPSPTPTVSTAAVAEQTDTADPRAAATARGGLALPLIAAAVVLLAVNAVLFLLPVQKSSSTVARDQVLSAAKADTALVISYNYQHIDADEAKAAATLTGAFATEYQKSINTQVKVLAPKVKAVVEGQVDSAAIEAVSGDGKQVTVIVFGQQKVSNSSLSQPRTDLVRLRVTMTEQGKVWKISQLSQI